MVKTYFGTEMVKPLRQAIAKKLGRDYSQADFAGDIYSGVRAVQSWESANRPRKMTMALRVNCLSLMQDHGIEAEDLVTS
jgi:DNA-binding transcriptional regulator YiaG